MTAAAAPSRPARRCDALGGTAIVLGLCGIGLGLFAAGATWFVVVPAGLLTMIFGLIDVSRARHDVTANGRTAIIGVVAGAVALALGCWGTGMFLGELNQLSHNMSSPTATPVWGQDHVFADGITVNVATPVVTSTGPSLALTVTATNDTAKAITLNPPAATFTGRPLTEDTGAKAVTVPSGGSVTYRLGYRLPALTGELRLEFQPTPGSPPGIVAGRV